MTISVLGFGVVKDIFGGSLISIEIPKTSDTVALKKTLEQKYSRLQELSSYRIAINSEYITESRTINKGDEIAIIPPVSGG